jgi:hypothetical protein
MRCQYSRWGPVSSEKHEMAAEAGAEEGKGEVGSILTAMVAVGGCRSQPELPEVERRAAKAAKTLRSRTPARLYLDDTLLERLAYNLKHIAFEFGLLV